MKKVKFIYNPYSGESTIALDLDKIIMVHQKYEHIIVPYRICNEYPMSNAFADINEGYTYVLIAGGDGTIDSVVNEMKKRNINLPIAILPAGTANDFANYIGMPHDVCDACNQILESNVKKIDIGKINDKYFMNVASTGLFTDISQNMDINLKNTIGKLAYYVKGIEQLPNFRKLKIKVTSEEVCFDGDMYLMLVFNGQTAGSLKFAYNAKVDDGLLDVIIIKAGIMKNILNIFIKMLRNEHLENVEGIIYFKTKRLEVECFEDIVTDIDGERGPDFPLIIECEKNGISILGTKI
ncbi:YegS/Rv2252/BmrU family lipid kinase [Clostridium psychrophilum]|uniref:YegS/Rv2252/BmrU family lipid kinase n=1 Tax=Clostridium psychrophilum TaxID=132926 RepID=UPI001C0BBF34|nr:YegS/Rv2252/BmrU family lipid kinase [Clostridium psychrophilum]MBU3179602.1 YegS/Rv2252/BmrU family lipid kinase [Clostridium psychrophilum]